MVARLVRDPFDREGWFFELKWDDFRAIAETDGAGGVKLYSRRHNDFKRRFPPIVDALATLKSPTILDGEIVALDESGTSLFEWLVNRGQQKGTLVYYVFDCLMLSGQHLRQQPLHKRKEKLKRILKNQPRLLYVDHMEREGLASLPAHWRWVWRTRRRSCDRTTNTNRTWNQTVGTVKKSTETS